MRGGGICAGKYKSIGILEVSAVEKVCGGTFFARRELEEDAADQ